MRWQTIVRAILALAFVGVGALVYVQFRSRSASAPGTPAGTPQVTEASVVRAASNGVTKLTGEFGEVVYEVEYSEVREFADKRTEFDQARVMFHRGSVKHTIVAGRATLLGQAGPTGNQPAQIDFSGGVRLTAEDGVEVVTDGTATFYNVEQKTVIPGAMRFTRGRLSGAGVGADLYMDRSVLWINSEAELTVAPEADGGIPIHASATRIGLAEADHYMVLEENSVMTRQGQRLAATNARVSFAQVGDAVQFIELRGSSSVRSTDGDSTRPAMTAENINLAFTPETGLLTNARLSQDAVVETRDASGQTRVSGSQIDLFMAADGETLTKLEAADPVEVQLPSQGGQPAKTITSRTLIAEGDETRGLTRALFSGEVVYDELSPGGRGRTVARSATADSLSLGLRGELGAVDTATFRRAFKVIDGDLVATAEEGVYDAAAETLELRSPAGAARPKVVDPRFEIEANEIDANLTSDAIMARSEGRQTVQSFLTPSVAKSSGRARGAGLFEAGKAVTGTSVSLEYSAAEGLAVYDGAVYLRQGDSSLRAAHVEINDASGDVTAKGSVRSTLALAADDTSGGPPSKPVQIDAATMRYSDGERTAGYDTDVVFKADTGEETSADQLVLTLEAAERRLSTAVATAAAGQEVRVALMEGRQTRGTRVTYNAATDEYVVVGTPAVFVAPTPDQGPGECSVGSGTELRFTRTSRTAVVLNEGGAVGVMSSAKCAAVIK